MVGVLIEDDGGQATQGTGIRDANHAFLIGQMMGALIKAKIDAEPVMSGRDYTNEIVISRPSGSYRMTIVPES